LIKFAFKKDKAIEAILYVINYMNGLDGAWLYDILYSADKLHLEKYGRFIFGETYGATTVQVIPLNIMKLIYAKDTELFSAINSYNGWIEALKGCNKDLLSESDIECLEQSADSYNIGIHSYDEAWKKARQRNPKIHINDIYIEDIASQFKDGSDLLDYLKEIGELEAIWR
jgi:hypothetical protein